ncbi:MAG: SIS domain-containing protein, partial [Candidatus Margulisiibacteriota bacterium]
MVGKIEDLDSLEKIKEVDISGMLSVVAETPEMLLKAQELLPNTALRKVKKIRQVVVAGMGGSAIAGDIAAGLFSGKIDLPLYVMRGYRLPAFVGKETLFFALSYSGNTEETLSAVKEAERCGAKIICIASGGKLKEIAEKNNHPAYLIPSGYESRAALPYLLMPILKSLEEAGIISGFREELNKSVELLRKLRGEYGEGRPLRGNPVKQLAKKLLGKIP